MTDSQKLQLELFGLEAGEWLSDEYKSIMRSVRKYGKGKSKELQFISNKIKNRERRIAELEFELMQKSYAEKDLHQRIINLGDCGIPISKRTLDILTDIVYDRAKV